VLASAQRASERAARLYSVSAALATAESPEKVSDVVLNEGVAALRAAGGGVLLATNEDRLALRGAVGYDESVVASLSGESRYAELPAAYALRTGEPVWLESQAERNSRFPDLVGMEASTVSLCAVPLEVQGRRLGALRFSFREARLFDEEERHFVLALAALTAQALDRSQLQQARIDVSRRLQRSLLPPDLPVIPGLEAAAIYHPFGDGVDVGGDFYDLWEMGGGRWAVAIGDAAGTGPEAAALTALVRHTLRALTLSSTDPERLLHDLNAAMLAATSPTDDRFCTCIFGVVTPGRGAGPEMVELVLAGGGHPPVIVRRADGTVETVYVGGSLLGVFTDADVGTATIRLGPGDTAMLMTDGVLEARREGRQFGIEGVLGVVSAQVETADDAVNRLQRAVLAHTGGSLTDDMAAIALHVAPPPA
jgi:serine phosphatase RsbU (regulator of sigma subunit)